MIAATSKTYCEESFMILSADLYRVLDEHGPCTVGEITRLTGWSEDKYRKIVNLQPDYLVVVGFRKVNGVRSRGQALYYCRGEHVLGICKMCGNKNFHPSYTNSAGCAKCVSRPPYSKRKTDIRRKDLFSGDVNPFEPTSAKPGSPEKVAILCERYDAGLPLWHVEDAGYEGGESDYATREAEWEDWDED